MDGWLGGQSRTEEHGTTEATFEIIYSSTPSGWPTRRPFLWCRAHSYCLAILIVGRFVVVPGTSIKR